MATMQG